jgi:hypothetical protein
MNIVSDIALILTIPKAHMRWRGNLKGFLHERGWVKFADIVCCAPSMQPPQRMHIASSYEAVLWL